jgi:acyl dehydratase
MHIDPEWSKEHSPYPSTIAFGFLTMPLLTTFAHDLLNYDREGRIGGKGFPLNYGFNKLRLLSPVPVNSNVSAKLKLLNCEERKSGQSLLTYEVIINIDGHSKPAMIGEWLALWVDNASDVA